MNRAAAQDQAQAQAQMQAQQPQQPTTQPPNPGGGLSETAFGPLGDQGTQGMNPAGGGQPSAEMMPGLTREVVSGVDQNGRSIGG